MADFQNLSNAREVKPGLHTGDMSKMLQNLTLQGRIHFAIKKLRKSQVPEQTLSQSCRLMMPSWFVQKHGDKFHQTVLLRSGISSVPCKVQLTVVYTSSGVPEIKLGRGWRDFATYNRLVVGDSLIFELRRMSEFAVHIFRATATSNAVSLSHASIDSELSPKNENNNVDSSAGYSSRQHVAAQRISGISADGHVRDPETAKKREIRNEEATLRNASASRPTSCCINLNQVPESENIVQMAASLEKHPDSQTSQELPPINHAELGTPFSLREHESAHITGTRKKSHVRSEFQQPARVSLPSFTQRLVSYNVQDAVGNTCGAFFEVPSRFVMTHGLQLPGSHVQLQGIREESPVRPVTSSFHRMHRDGEPLMYLGWGDFVRENTLRAGQELVFTLAAESFFVVRESFVQNT